MRLGVTMLAALMVAALLSGCGDPRDDGAELRERNALDHDFMASLLSDRRFINEWPHVSRGGPHGATRPKPSRHPFTV